MQTLNETEPPASPRDSIPWIEWARTSAFQPESLARLFTVPLEPFDDCFECLMTRNLDPWLFEVRLWEAVRLLGEDYSLARVAADLGFAAASDFELIFLRYHRCHPARLMINIRRREARVLCQIERMFGQTDIPPLWAPVPVWSRAFRNLCQNARAWPVGVHQQVSGRMLLANLLHQSILAGHPRAPEVLGKLLLHPLMSWLSGQFAAADHQMISDGFTEALMGYLNRPASFDLKRGDLEPFLKRAAWCNVRDGARGALRRKRWETEWEEGFDPPGVPSVDCGPVGEYICGQSPAEHLERLETSENLQKLLEPFISLLDPEERKVFKLQVEDEHKISICAAALGLADQPKEDQIGKVNRLKNRLHKKLQRYLQARASEKELLADFGLAAKKRKRNQQKI